jgi:hypothetical protein
MVLYPEVVGSSGLTAYLFYYFVDLIFVKNVYFCKCQYELKVIAFLNEVSTYAKIILFIKIIEDKIAHLESISSALYARLFRTKFFARNFFVLRLKVCTFWRKNIGAKAARIILVKLTPCRKMSIKKTSFMSTLFMMSESREKKVIAGFSSTPN